MAQQSSSCRVLQMAQRRSIEGGPMKTGLQICLLGGCSLLAVSAQIPRFQHVVVIFQENRTPDNLFQGLCTPPFGSADTCSSTALAGKYDIQTDNWLDKSSTTGVTHPVIVALANKYDLSHAHSAFVAMCDAEPSTGVCKMDGAAAIACSGMCSENKPQFRFVDNSRGIVNPYLTLATQYGWANLMFQTNQGPSFPAHQFIFGGTSAPSIVGPRSMGTDGAAKVALDLHHIAVSGREAISDWRYE